MSLTFPISHRLRVDQDYKHLFKTGQYSNRGQDSCFRLLIGRNALDYPRLGMRVAKKHLKLAVQRNHVKRLIREGFRQNQHLLGGVDIVVIATKSIKTASLQSIKRDLISLWLQE